MNLSKEHKERLISGIQAGLGLLILALSVKNGARMKSKEMGKLISRRAKAEGKLAKQEYKWKKKLLAKQYKQKIAAKTLQMKKEQKNAGRKNK